MARLGRVFAIAAVWIMLVAGDPSLRVSAQGGQEDCRYFPQTEHYVCDAFLQFYHSRGGTALFGYPLTDAYHDQALNLRVQYFQNFRMEWHPNNPDPYKVQLGLLVDEMGIEFPPLPESRIPSRNSRLHHYFPETGHTVSYEFLDFFRDHGGIDVFGYPRSEFMEENGYVVQYFQRARMEWRPGGGAGPSIKLTPLGAEFIEKRPDTPSRFEPLEVSVHVAVRHSFVVGRRAVQTVFIYVEDQEREPVSGAETDMVVRYQSDAQSMSCGETNTQGFARCDFELAHWMPGEKAIVHAQARYRGVEAQGENFFWMWEYGY